MECFFSSPKTQRKARKAYRTSDEARADVFDYIERFYNPRRRHSKLSYLSPMEFEACAMLALPTVHETGSRLSSLLPTHRAESGAMALRRGNFGGGQSGRSSRVFHRHANEAQKPNSHHSP